MKKQSIQTKNKFDKLLPVQRHELSLQVLKNPHQGDRAGNSLPRQEKQLKSCVEMGDILAYLELGGGEGNDRRLGWGTKPRVLT